jgi:hypothetical protein
MGFVSVHRTTNACPPACPVALSTANTQAPHIHFLLLEAADILRLHPLPKVQVVQAHSPFVRLLRIPLTGCTRRKSAKGPVAAISGSNNSSSGGSVRCVLRCQQASVLVLSSAAMQVLQPAELQAAMASALAPLALQGGFNLVLCAPITPVLQQLPVPSQRVVQEAS